MKLPGAFITHSTRNTYGRACTLRSASAVGMHSVRYRYGGTPSLDSGKKPRRVEIMNTDPYPTDRSASDFRCMSSTPSRRDSVC